MSGRGDEDLVVGFRVVVPALTEKGKPRPISRVFAVRSAADTFVELARRMEGLDAFVVAVHHVDGLKL
jgi:hypothetical protein